MSHHTNQSGFIALISILIVSSVLLATTLSLAQFGIANRYFILELEHKTVSEKLAEACVHVGRIAAYNDPAAEITNPKTIPVGDRTCDIITISRNSDESTIETKGQSNTAITNYRVVVDNTTGDFLTWEEVNSL